MQQNKSKTLLIIIGSMTVSYLILLGYLIKETYAAK